MKADADDLTADIRIALRAAADRVHVVTSDPPLEGDLAAAPRRWLVPALCAAVVVAVALVATALVTGHAHGRTAPGLTVAGATADLGGVRFPIPAGWNAVVQSQTGVAVTVCVSATDPAADSCDGVQLITAIPDRDGRTEKLPESALFELCPGGVSNIIQVDDSVVIDVAGRPGIHYRKSCGAAGPVTHLWRLTDLSLEVLTPPGQWADQAQFIVAGLDLSGWAHSFGPQQAFWTSATTTN